MSDKFELSRRKALLGLGTVGLAGAGAGVGTSALYSDTERVNNNTITAGTQNLIVNAEIVDDSTFDNNAGSISISGETSSTATADGGAAVGINVDDIKPGDCFVIGVDAHVVGNPGYLAVSGNVTENADNVNTEPEVGVDGNLSNSTDNQGTPGELAGLLEIRSLGYVDGDANNGIPSGSVTITDDDGFPGDFPNSSGGAIPLTDLLNGLLYRGRGGTPPAGHGGAGDSATRVGDTGASNVDTGQVTHLIEICLPTEVGNIVQGDSLKFNLTWSTEQVRNNPVPDNASEVDGSVNPSS